MLIPFYKALLERCFEEAGDGGTGSAGSSNSDNNTDDKKPKYTEDDLQAKLRGSGKALSERDKRILELEQWKAEQEKAAAEAERKRLEKAGEHQKLAEQANARAEAAEAKAAQYEAKEKARLERLSANNDERVKALPKHLQKLIHSSLDPDAVAEMLPELEKLSLDSSGKARNVDGGAGRGGKRNAAEENRQAGHDFVFGKGGV